MSSDYKINLLEKIIFIHIPKTGGTSIINSLGLKTSTHIKAKEIIEEKPDIDIRNYFSFAVVRNPFDRFLSLYSYARKEISLYHNNIEPEKALYGSHMDYNLLKDATLEECANFLLCNRLKHDQTWNQWSPQYTWLYDNEGNLLIDKVYKLENLSNLKSDFKSYFEVDLNISHLNISKDKPIKINKSTKAIVEQYYEKDFVLFNY